MRLELGKAVAMWSRPDRRRWYRFAAAATVVLALAALAVGAYGQLHPGG